MFRPNSSFNTPGAAPLSQGPELRFGPLSLDSEQSRAYVDGRPVNLTRVEFGLLHLVVSHAPRVVTCDELVRRVIQGVHRPESSLLRVHICHLRRKLGAAGAAIMTIRGQGFWFDGRKLAPMAGPAPDLKVAPPVPQSRPSR